MDEQRHSVFLGPKVDVFGPNQATRILQLHMGIPAESTVKELGPVDLWHHGKSCPPRSLFRVRSSVKERSGE